MSGVGSSGPDLQRGADLAFYGLKAGVHHRHGSLRWRGTVEDGFRPRQRRSGSVHGASLVSLLRFLRANPIAACLLLVAVASAVFFSSSPASTCGSASLSYRSVGGSSGFGGTMRSALFRSTNDALIAWSWWCDRLGRGEAGATGKAEGRPIPTNVTVVPVLDAGARPAAPGQRHPQEQSAWRLVEVDRSAAGRPMSRCGGSPAGANDNCRSSLARRHPRHLVRRRRDGPAEIRPHPRNRHRGRLRAPPSINRTAFGGDSPSDVIISFGLTLLLVAVTTGRHRTATEVAFK